jgi:SAM-dependent methyltransferase
MTDDLVAETQATYDRVADDYDRRTRAAPSDEFLQFRAEFLAAVTGPVVDLGCGPGRDVSWLCEQGLVAFGVDLSQGMLARARRHGLPVVRGDLRRPPIRPGSLGGIWSNAALLHVPRDDVPATLRQWHALIASGGRLGIATSLGGDEGWELVPYDGPGPEGGELHRWFVHHDVDGLHQLLAAAGFTVLSTGFRTTHRTWAQVHAIA